MHRLSIVVPYRAREAHLRLFVPAAAAFFARVKSRNVVVSSVLVVEQEHGLPFNRGALNNIGYLLSRNEGDYTCFHDVDYLPVEVDYSWSETPVAIVWHGAESRPIRAGRAQPRIVHDLESFFGGVVLTSNRLFERVDGYANGYWGWGYEDDDLRKRFQAIGVAFGRRRGVFQPLDHDSAGFEPDGSLTPAAIGNRRLFERRWRAGASLERDGLITLKFEVLDHRSLSTGHGDVGPWRVVTVRLRRQQQQLGSSQRLNGETLEPATLGRQWSASRELDAGLAAYRAGDMARAAPLARKAALADPSRFDAWLLFGAISTAIGRRQTAIECFDQAISLQPDNVEARLHKGAALHLSERYEEALASYDDALSRGRDNFDVLANRGTALHELGRDEEAIASYNEALAIRPNDAQTLFNRGNAFQALENFAGAIADYDRAVHARPGYRDALLNRGAALLACKRPEAALASFDALVGLNSKDADAHFYRGNSLHELGLFAEAISAYDLALALRPDLVAAVYNRANSLCELGEYRVALEGFDTTLRMRPDHAQAFDRAVSTAMRLCEWRRLGLFAGNFAARVRDEVGRLAPFTLLGISDDPELQRHCAQLYAGRFKSIGAKPLVLSRRHRTRFRIAYLSADFRRHALSHLISETLELHDRQYFEVHGISFGPDEDSQERARFIRSFDSFHDARRLTDAEVVSLARDLRIDIAVDLNGYTRHARPGVFARRTAPIQVNYLGFPGTMGADFMDYIILDAMVAPSLSERHFAETIVRLPDAFQANDTRRQRAQYTPTRAEVGLPPTGFVFCCFNDNWKITPEVFELWMRLLQQTMDGVLWLLCSDKTARDNLRCEAKLRGVDPARLVFAPRISHPEHLARHHLADLFLDTFPYNAHTTASDALWSGLPILTRAGRSFASRVAASLLTTMDLAELITSDAPDYERKASELARAPEKLAALRHRLDRARTSSPLFDARQFTRSLENAFKQMIEARET